MFSRIVFMMLLIVVAATTVSAQDPFNQNTIEQIYLDTFQTGASDGNIDLLLSSYWHDDIPLYWHVRSGFLLDTGSDWGEDLAEFETYELLLETPLIVYDDNVGVSVARYVAIEGDNRSSGIDVFAYVKTADGWRIATLTGADGPPRNDPRASAIDELRTFVTDFADNINTNDGSALTRMFMFDSDPFVMPLDTIGAFDATLHSVEAFVTTIENVEISLNNVDIQTHENVTAHVVANYQLSGTTEATGKLFLTLVDHPSRGWRITAALLS